MPPKPQRGSKKIQDPRGLTRRRPPAAGGGPGISDNTMIGGITFGDRLREQRQFQEQIDQMDQDLQESDNILRAHQDQIDQMEEALRNNPNPNVNRMNTIVQRNEFASVH